MTGSDRAVASRLAELAAERGDVEALSRLVDEGNERAGHRLAELAAQSGDVATLNRLVDEGNAAAANRLSQLIRDTR